MLIRWYMTTFDHVWPVLISDSHRLGIEPTMDFAAPFDRSFTKGINLQHLSRRLKRYWNRMNP